MIGYAVPGWPLLLFVTLRRLRPLMKVLLITSLGTSLVFPLHPATARTFTLTVTVPGIDTASPLPVAAIQVFAGACLVAEATPSLGGSAAFVLPAGNYVVSARTNADGRMAGWAMFHVATHLDRDLDVALNHEVVPLSDINSMCTAPPPHCPGR